MLLFYGKNIFCNISIPTNTENSYIISWQKELKCHVLLVPIINYANSNFFIRKTEKHIIAYFFENSPLPPVLTTISIFTLHFKREREIDRMNFLQK